MEQVLITLHTRIMDDGEEETSQNTYRGHYYEKNNLEVLSFEEKTEDQYLIKSLITIQPEKVTIKRSGLISMNQQFRKDQITESIYTHPHGHMRMETFTNAITYQVDDQQTRGQLKIDYTVKLNGQEERHHMLTLTYQKEDIQ
ncbi:DUF1934 domain-containing protein [Ornithinibacillus bavariensis]|uniref:DUF1934 domain-containing protein n=1 Tax=Ornithinibacillus bavariensis TaxID=545502 RepID=A0A919X966_9BACI|nr:DUF1934 domain-containing protein [Ornithinibacillus bavariensis]GIO26820.1 hypothetical protein J43TS3_14310 [Ornithinibacillus bavariensis]HAM80732.1 DUF1934 domain-containing protein [Ornithinibacillus sp.]